MREINWAELDTAFGSAENVPELLAQAGSADPDVVDEALGELYGTIVHQGSVYSSTAPALPFLLDIAANPDARHRSLVVGLIAAAADGGGPGHPVGDVLGAHRNELFAFLADDDPVIRELAAYTLGHVDGIPADALRWDVETEPLVRASILVAAAEPSWLPAALAEGGPVAAAAAFVLARDGLTWPDGASEALLGAFADGDPLDGWVWDEQWLHTLLDAVPEEVLGEIARGLAASPHEDVRRYLIDAAADAMAMEPGKATILVPVLTGLLDDASARVRDDAACAVRDHGCR